jgi:hypothetical protein
MPRNRQTVATLGDIPAIKELSKSLPKRSLENEHRPQRAARKRGDDALNTLAERVGKMMESLGQDTANKVEPVAAKVEPVAAKVEPVAAKVRKCSVCARPGHNKRTCPEAAPAPKAAAPVPRKYGVLDSTFNKVLDLVEALPREEQAAFRGQLESLDDEAKVCGEWYLHPESSLGRVLGTGAGAKLLVGLILPYLKERGLL